MKITLFSDGGSRGNPGPAGIGVVIRQIDEKTHKNTSLKEISEFIGVGTNNIAEYTAILQGLKWIKENTDINDLSVECFLDSQLVVEQLCGRYKMKNEGLKPLFWEIRDLILALGGQVTFKHIPREQNAEADLLVNLALDKELKGDK
jgi:ribonuclease HI